MDSKPNSTWHDVQAACTELRKVMDGMIEQSGLDSFRPGIAHAIAKARDEQQIATRSAMHAKNAIY